MTTALVTGASRGIGRAIALQLVARGCTVLAGVREASHAPEGTEALILDVSDSASIARAAAQVRATRPSLHILINNAGILRDEGTPVLDIDEGDFRDTLEVNTLGPWRVVRAFLPFMPRGGRIINVSSSGGQMASMGSWIAPSYCISKAALNALTLQLAPPLRLEGISVNSMCPGWVRTDMGGAGATLTPEQGADTALWLALEAPASLTGKFIQKRREIDW